ncbi:MAG: SDR family NAD(P)-dependent oxidoreductase [Acidimicrobiia bacterium]
MSEPDDDGLRGRAGLVTGGGSGIGRATALELARRGVAVVVADLDGAHADAVATEIRAAGGKAVGVAVDVTDPEACVAAVAACVDGYGTLDLAVNSAGTTGLPGSAVDYPIDAWRATMAVNLDGVFFSMRAELPVMVAAGRGAIVNVASGAGIVGFAGLPAYVASKHGVVGLTRSAALECASRGVRVNAVCPGSARTPMLEGFMGGDAKVERMMTAGVPLGRLATPEEIAHGIVWLCSDAATYMIGHALVIDGGATVQ